MTFTHINTRLLQALGLSHDAAMIVMEHIDKLEQEKNNAETAARKLREEAGALNALIADLKSK